jgi:hypothetical protein
VSPVLFGAVAGVIYDQYPLVDLLDDLIGGVLGDFG